MADRDDELPFDVEDFRLDIEALLRAFRERLKHLKDLSGLSWGGFARILGVDRKRCRRRADGTEPTGGSVLAVFNFASRIPGGLDILLGLLTDPDLPDDDEDEEEGQGQEHEQEDDEA